MDIEAFEWVLVCGGFHPEGGMDRANAALAAYLARRGTRLHLVAHRVDGPLRDHPSVSIAQVPRHGGLYFTSDFTLDRRARRVARDLRRSGSQVLVVANGGNCGIGDVNWVHSVHHAWPCRDDGAPAWFRGKNRLVKAWARSRERSAIRHARTVIANSNRTRRDVIELLGVDETRVHTVYLGSDPAWSPPGPSRRDAMRRKWCRDPLRPMVAFVGALGHDTNKGLDRLLGAWGRLNAGGWSGELVVAGPGDTRRWQRAAQAAGGTVRIAGHTADVDEILDSADVMVSPVAYEAYGLAVHEAICRGVPAIVSRAAGVAERLPGDLAELLLGDPADVEELAGRIRTWAANPERWRERTLRAGDALRAFSEQDMAARIVAIAGNAAAPAGSGCRSA